MRYNTGNEPSFWWKYVKYALIIIACIVLWFIFNSCVYAKMSSKDIDNKASFLSTLSGGAVFKLMIRKMMKSKNYEYELMVKKLKDDYVKKKSDEKDPLILK